MATSRRMGPIPPCEVGCGGTLSLCLLLWLHPTNLMSQVGISDLLFWLCFL